ncbi:hypothetical protein LJ737_16590 [Hymenobacter sp. 15J16-1T3B]|uniref:hypothetical protein n=1 Tax=Hymenobacter sp. 15J16-1T3B TaxID=2886941 RepID=UPI001D129303|nr:hypothetical protein [Hymenobacter sp. 15J16-1T3B]MCC3158863.1 hypothetical protein [Hymenobacter sp. 15J16-1T3B]
MPLVAEPFTSDMSPLRTDILLAIQNALLGEVEQHLRAVAFDYSASIKYIKLYFYLDRMPNEEDEEWATNVMTEFLASFSFKDFDTAQAECLFSNSKNNMLNPFSGFAFLRKEAA